MYEMQGPRQAVQCWTRLLPGELVRRAIGDPCSVRPTTGPGHPGHPAGCPAFRPPVDQPVARPPDHRPVNRFPGLPTSAGWPVSRPSRVPEVAFW